MYCINYIEREVREENMAKRGQMNKMEKFSFVAVDAAIGFGVFGVKL